MELVDRPAFFASSAAMLERTDVIIICEDVEAASLSATSAAMEAALLFGVWALSVVLGELKADGCRM